MLQSIDRKKGLQLLYHGPTVMISSYDNNNNRTNVFALSWITPVNSSPPQVVIGVSRKNYSYQLIKDNQEFAVNIPDVSLVKELHKTGTVSGRDLDKIKECGLSCISSDVIKTSLIKGCIGYLECRVIDSKDLKDHTIFIADVVAASVERDKYSGFSEGHADSFTLHYLGGKKYVTLGKIIEV